MSMENILTSLRFRQALFDVQSEECERLAALPGTVTFSPRFERKMERLLRVRRRPFYRYADTAGKKAVLALAAALILLVSLVFSVSAIRGPVVRFFIEVYEKFSQVFFQQQGESFPAALEVYYAPAWLPEGYREDTGQMVNIFVQCERAYICEGKDDILFIQHVITGAWRIDTEGTQAKPVLVNGNEGFYYSNKEIQRLTWSDGQYGFLVSGTIAEADLLRIAESIHAIGKNK